MDIDEVWIRAHLPEEYKDESLGCFNDYFVGVKGIYYEERGRRELIYPIKDEAEVRLWTFKYICKDIAQRVELNNREQNAKKWRYSAVDPRSSDYKYVERRRYIYNAIEDSRLVWMELYLQLIKGVVSDVDWHEEVKEQLFNMNYWFLRPHWAYDYDNLRFKEISDSKSYRSKENPVLEPQPWEIIEVI